MSAEDRQPSLDPGAAGGEREPGFRAIGVAVAKLARPVIGKRRGGLLVRLKADWTAIAGADWAAVTWPAALGGDGALKLRTVPTAALEAQHRAPLLIERINLFFGRRVVRRLVLVQVSSASWSAPPPQPRAARGDRALDQHLADVADPLLRAALGRLGRAIASRN
ncbi:MAG: DciA family protein [Stellaceae bacterium]